MLSRLAKRNQIYHSHKADTALEEHFLDDLRHLESVGREIQERLDIREAVISEERVDTKVTGVIGHLIDWVEKSKLKPSPQTPNQLTSGMRKVGEHVTLVQSSHGELGDDHLQERRESRENAKLLGVETES